MSLVQVQGYLGKADWVGEEREREFVEQAKRDREGFAVLYRQHYRMLSNHLFRRTGDVHATEDLVADVYLIALRTLARYQYRGVPVRFWLLRLATNAANRWARRRKRQFVAELQPDELADPSTTESSTRGEVDREQARRAFLTLAPKYQAVLSLHYFEGLAVKEVASVIGCRVGTVKSRLARARDALREKLDRRRQYDAR